MINLFDVHNNLKFYDKIQYTFNLKIFDQEPILGLLGQVKVTRLVHKSDQVLDKILGPFNRFESKNKLKILSKLDPNKNTKTRTQLTRINFLYIIFKKYVT